MGWTLTQGVQAHALIVRLGLLKKPDILSIQLIFATIHRSH